MNLMVWECGIPGKVSNTGVLVSSGIVVAVLIVVIVVIVIVVVVWKKFHGVRRRWELTLPFNYYYYYYYYCSYFYYYYYYYYYYRMVRTGKMVCSGSTWSSPMTTHPR